MWTRRCGCVGGALRGLRAAPRPRRSCATRPGPPWRVLFFGSDGFAAESLERLHASSSGPAGGIVETLEVVTLSSSAPVQRLAERRGLKVHSWPDVDAAGRFDVGVVVSFGCLLPERLIGQLPCGILNVHPSLLPRWRGPAPVFHTVLHGDTITGVTIMQIRPKRFDVGPILHQEVCRVPERCTAEELGASLATVGARLLMETLENLPERILHQQEQSKEGATFAPKINSAMSWILWEQQTCVQIDRLYRAIGSRVRRWGGVELALDSVLKESNILAVFCKDGWVGFRTVKLKKSLSAADFYNGYLHQGFQKRVPAEQVCAFRSGGAKKDAAPTAEPLLRSKTSH
uniref:methionyl-tRNA formyltransferase n=1 Tax=Denticeps clupeoides TaxID=299321 RepID=A0AAY4BUM3_9TELE